MSAYNKILWTEGLFLRPQHFQQESRHVERLIETRCAALRSYSWGFVELEIERDMLAIGKFALRRAVGVFPDGTPFRMPEDEPLPAPLDVGPQVRDEIIYLALPVRQNSAADIDRSEGQEAIVRHSARQVDARDSTTEAGTTESLEVAPLRTRLMLSHQTLDDYAKIPIGVIIERRSDQRVVLEERFIASVLDAKAAPVLNKFLTELQGLLHQRGDALAGRVSATGRGGAAEISDFLMLQLINRNEPVVANLCAGGIVHPEDLYRYCAALAGELATFTTIAKRPPAYPAYTHDGLRESFEPLMASLRASLNAVIDPMVVSIPIELLKHGYRSAAVADRTLFNGAVFVIAARADVPAEDVRRNFPSLFKISGTDKITEIARLQLPGITLRPMPTAPRQLPFHAGSSYFELDQASELWAAIKRSGTFGMFISEDEFPGLAVEFWAIRA